MFSKIHIMHIIFMYVYKSFTTLDKGLRKNIEKREMEELENKLS